jgi:hypothetical protein
MKKINLFIMGTSKNLFFYPKKWVLTLFVPLGRRQNQRGLLPSQVFRGALICVLGLVTINSNLLAKGSEGIEIIISEPKSEMDAIRMMMDKPIATFQDLADALILFRGEFDTYKTFEDRRNRINELGIFSFENISEPLITPISRGNVSKALHKSFMLEKGFFYMVTGIGRYAHRDMQLLEIMDHRYSAWDHLTGGSLVGVIEKAERVEKTNQRWGHEQAVSEEN